jgi:hypothetical protein
MSNSIVLYHGRDDALHVIDPDGLTHYDDLPPVFNIVIAVINAGYRGVLIDEKRLANGRFMHCLNAAEGTPEGQVIKYLVSVADAGEQLPSIGLVLEQIKKLYDKLGDSHD